MNIIRHDLLYWHLFYDLVSNHHFRIVELNLVKDEVWLEREKEKEIIRLKRIDIDWANWLRKDIETISKLFDNIRRQSGYRDIKGYNIYISMYPPIDSWDEHIEEPVKYGVRNQTEISTFLIEQEEQKKTNTITTLYRLWNLPLPKFDDWEQEDGSNIASIREEIIRVVEEQSTKEKAIFSYGKPFLTYLLLLINGIMFGILEIYGGSTNILTLIEYGAKYNPLIVEGEYWRFLTAMFLHIGFLHFFMNTLALFFLGSFVEKIYGTSRFFVIYFIAGIFGSVVSFAFNNQVAAGASGAIFGCFGALLYFGLIHRTLFFRTIGKSIIFILGINLAFGFLVPMIDNAAHIGGLIGGFLASSFLHLPKNKKKGIHILFFLGTLALLFLTLIFGFFNEEKRDFPLVQLQIAQELLQQGEIELAHPLLTEFVSKGTDMPEAFFLLAYAEAHLGHYEQAKEHLYVTISLRPSFHEAHYNLALVYIELGDYEAALQSVTKAIELHPEEQLYMELLERL